MLSRMGLVMLAGKGILGTRTGRMLVGRLGRSAARRVFGSLGGLGGHGAGQGGGRQGRQGGRSAGCGGGEQPDGLWKSVLDVLPKREASASAPEDVPVGSVSGDRRREAALAALAAHIVSFTDGRVRLRHPALRHAGTHAPLQEALARTGCFTALTFSERTGSILLEYDGRHLSRADFCEAALPLGWFLAQCDRPEGA